MTKETRLDYTRYRGAAAERFDIWCIACGNLDYAPRRQLAVDRAMRHWNNGCHEGVRVNDRMRHPGYTFERNEVTA